MALGAELLNSEFHRESLIFTMILLSCTRCSHPEDTQFTVDPSNDGTKAIFDTFEACKAIRFGVFGMTPMTPMISRLAVASLALAMPS
jgi:hypothetical protein